MSVDELLQHIFTESSTDQLKDTPIVVYVGYVALHQCKYLNTNAYEKIMQRLAKDDSEVEDSEE